MRRLLLSSLLLSSFFTLLLFTSTPPTLAQLSDAPQNYAQDIDLFFSRGAQSYIAWQYSGDVSNPIENDRFSFFSGGPTCQVLQQKGQQYPGRIGVNVHALSNKTTSEISAILNYVRDNCGASIVRFWGFGSPTSILNVMQVIRSLNMRAIIALEDFGTTNSIPWYTSGYTATYLSHAQAVAQALVTGGFLNSLYVLELAN